MKFYLGTHREWWLRLLDVSLFVSDVRLRGRKSLPRARKTWALDSGGFSALDKNGRWPDTARDYAARVRRYRDEIGLLEWAPVRDWMCEDRILKKTGLTIRKHQELTIDSLFELQELEPGFPWVPVVQGSGKGSHLDHLEMYARRGVDLLKYPLVGIGSVCRLQSKTEGTRIVRELRWAGLEKLHGFGFKTLGLAAVGTMLTSADSLAWSFSARKKKLQMDGCTHSNCANCHKWALAWRKDLLDKIAFGAHNVTTLGESYRSGASNPKSRRE